MQFLRQKSADKVKYIVIAAVLALISSVAAAYYFQFFGVAVNSSLFLVLFVSTLRCEKDLKKTDLPGILVCWLFWFLTMQGALLSADELLSAKRLLLMAAGSIDFAVVLCRVLKAMDPLARHLLNGTEGRRPVDSHTLYWKVWLPSFVIMLLCWLPTLLAFYPGLFTNDVPDQAVETMGAYHTHHPLIHTLFLQACLHVGDLFGNANIGVVLYCVIQMSLLAAAMAAVLTFTYRQNGGELYLFLIQLFFSLFPVFPILAISTTKDIIHTAFFTLFVLYLAMMEEDPKRCLNSKRRVALFIASGVFAMLFRHNAIFVIPPVLIILCLQKRTKEYRRKLIRILALTVVFFVLINEGLIFATHATGDSTHNEMLSVPYQQLARVYTMKQDELSDEEKQEILRFIPTAEQYNPIRSDIIKESGKAEEDIRGFVGLYVRMLKRYPCTYLESFLINTEGYWYIDDITGAVNYGCGAFEGTVGYMYMYIWEYVGVTHISLFPALEKWYKFLFARNYYLYIPVLSALFRCGLYLWIGVWCLIRSYRRKQHGGMVYVTLALLLMTLLLGPVVCLRYVLPFLTCFPIVVTLSWCDTEQPDENEVKIQQ